MQRGIARLEAAGHRVDGKEVLDRRVLRFAGTDEQRAADINGLADPARPLPGIALAVRGGYGAHPLLPLLDYERLGTRLRDGTVALVGHSDFTAVQCALFAKAGIVTYGGPMDYLADPGLFAEGEMARLGDLPVGISRFRS